MSRTKKTTSLDVAKLAGVSQSTVSFVLNGRTDISISSETRQRVLSAAEELNYIPNMFAKGLKMNQSKIIGVLIPNISNPFYPMLIQSLENHAAAMEYSLLLCNTNRNKQSERYYLRLLMEKGVDAIVVGFTPSEAEHINTLSSSIPIVIIGETDEQYKVHTIGLNSVASGELLARHLTELGHQHIAFVSSPLNSVSLSRKKRLQGVRDYLKQMGLEKNLIIKTANYEYESSDSTFEVEVGYQITKELIQDNPVTAIIGVNDMVAFGVMQALNEAGVSVPRDISVCGFDNLYLSRILTPKITTVDHAIQQQAKIAINAVVDMLEHKEQNIFKMEYQSTLLIRESTGTAPQVSLAERNKKVDPKTII